MKKILGFIAIIFSLASAQTDNFKLDTVDILSFRADSIKYSKWLPLSLYENLTIVAMSNDTSSAGYKSDSVSYFWGIQYGDPTLNYLGKNDTAVSNPPVCIDTFSCTNADTQYLNITKYGKFDSTGFSAVPLRYIDSTYVSGYLTQSRNVIPEYHGYFRIFAKGLAGNKKGSILRQRFAVIRRVFIGVRTR